MKRITYSFILMSVVIIPLMAQSHRSIERGDQFEHSVQICKNALLTEKVVKVLEMMKERYPEARYRDVYKNFMQDYFGPGHILTDTVASGEYLRYELKNAKRFDGDLYEPTGYNGNFYRVNISLIKDGIISYDDYFSAFVRSAQGIVPPEIEEWRREWKAIDGIIQSNGFVYEDDDADREMILNQLTEGNPVVHHSAHFNSAYSLHYRIISREIFNKEILPKILAKIQEIEE